MYKYVITWIVTSIVAVPCEDPTDEFGRGTNISFSVNCFETRNTPQIKEYISYRAAMEFYIRARKEELFDSRDPGIMKDEIHFVKLDSIKL